MLCPNCKRELKDGEICNCTKQIPVMNQENTASASGTSEALPENTEAKTEESPKQKVHDARIVRTESKPPLWTDRAAGYNDLPTTTNPDKSAFSVFKKNENKQIAENPYETKSEPPVYKDDYWNEPEESLLTKYKAAPSFLAARQLLSSMPVLMFNIAVSLFLFYVVFFLSEWMHPMLVLLCIAGWMTYITGIKSNKNNSLPSVGGLSLASGVATIMMIVWCIIFGFLILLFSIGIIKMLIDRGFSGSSPWILLMLLVISILLLAVGIRYYGAQARALKTVKYIITGEASPKRISAFPSVVLIIFSCIQAASTVGLILWLRTGNVVNSIKGYYEDYMNSLNVSQSVIKTLNEAIEEMFTGSSVSSLLLLYCLLSVAFNLSKASFFMKAASALNQYTEI